MEDLLAGVGRWDGTGGRGRAGRVPEHGRLGNQSVGGGKRGEKEWMIRAGIPAARQAPQLSKHTTWYTLIHTFISESTLTQ